MSNFTTVQRIKGLLCTFRRGDYSLMVSRLRENPKNLQQEMVETMAVMMTKEERAILRRYLPELF